MNNGTYRIIVIFLLLLSAVVTDLVALDVRGSAPPERGYRQLANEKGTALYSRIPERDGTLDERFDLLHYVIALDIDPQLHFISGTVRAYVRVTALPLDSLFLHLKDTMFVDDVAIGGIAIPHEHAGGRISFATGGAFDAGDTVIVQVRYHGYPVDQGLRFRSESVYNVSEPDMARNWFPCYDEPWDKATSEMIVTVPDTLYCASNGLLESTTDNLDGTVTYHWKTRYPLTTYSTSIAIAPYEVVSQWYRYTPADSMEMPLYVYQDRITAAEATFSHVPGMMHFFVSRFGEYPFIEEKYGTALVQMNGAMENFTCTSIDRRRADGTLDHDWVLAHELAHSWFGNSVTMLDWSDIWLNEGFATFSDALWEEEQGGPAAYRGRMDFFKTEYFTEDASNRFSVYDPEFLWGATVYEKGAWVLHMLRHLMGDENFFDSLRQYHMMYRYGSATTGQFRDVCESVSALDLGSFFDEWIYQAGYPEYQLSWTYEPTGGNFDAIIRLRQTQQNAPIFTIPIEIAMTTAAGDTLFEIVPHSADEEFFITLTAEPLSLAFDPGDWILKTFEAVPSSSMCTLPPENLAVTASPNPGNGSEVRFDFYLPNEELIILEIYDVLGRRIDIAVRERRSASWNSAYWTPASGSGAWEGSGIYFYRLRAGSAVASGKITIIR